MNDQIVNINQSINDLADELYELLSIDHINYMVEAKGKIYNFITPTTQEEAKEQNDLRYELIKIVLIDALGKVIDNVNRFGGIPDEWDLVRLFAEYPTLEDIASPISPEEIQAVKDEHAEGMKSLPLNLDSVHVNMQREGWTQEDQEKFILEKENVD